MGKNNKKTRFDENWLLEEDFKIWLGRIEKDDNSARCLKCLKTFSLSNMGRKALTDHQKGKKHIAKMITPKDREMIKDHFKKQGTENLNAEPIQEKVMNSSCKINENNASLGNKLIK